MVSAVKTPPKNQGNDHAAKLLGELVPRSIQFPEYVWTELDELVTQAKAAKQDGLSVLKGRLGRADILIGLHEVFRLVHEGKTVSPDDALAIVIGTKLTDDDSRIPYSTVED